MKKKRMPLFAILLLGACSLYTCGSLITRHNWYLSHNDYTHFQTEEQVEAFLSEHLVIGQSTREEVTTFLDTLNLYRCISREDVDSQITRFGIGCWVRSPKPDPSQLDWLDQFPYVARHFWYYMDFQIDNGILEDMFVALDATII